jgi:GH35 family endo-1,4-beta-xylanase
MKQRTVLYCLVIFALAITTACSQNKTQPATTAVPHLEKRGPTTQMIVDGKPFLMLVGELANTKSSNLEEMQTRIWPMLADKIHANTIITGMSWSWVEPEEGKYDFSIADAAIENAKQHDMRIVWMWFASWKNGLSSFAPTWVKANQ